ncbi:MAG: hypothetical protein ACK5MV_13720 [Aminipila sp.]
MDTEVYAAIRYFEAVEKGDISIASTYFTDYERKKLRVAINSMKKSLEVKEQ